MVPGGLGGPGGEGKAVQPTVYGLLGAEIAIKTADNYRALRKRGITVRKTADTIIATFCIERRTPLLYSDRDFDPFVRHLGLKSALSGANVSGSIRKVIRRARRKPAEFTAALAHLHVRHDRRPRAAPRPLDHRLHRFGRTLNHRFDGAVVPVPHPARDSQLARLALHPHAVAYALDLASDPQVLDGCHAEKNSIAPAEGPGYHRGAVGMRCATTSRGGSDAADGNGK